MNQEYTIINPPLGAVNAVTTTGIDEYGRSHAVTLAKTKVGNIRSYIGNHLAWPTNIGSSGMIASFQIPAALEGMMTYLIPLSAWQAVTTK